MKIFSIEDFNPIPTEEFFLIEEFKELFTIKYNMNDKDDKTGRLRNRGSSEARLIYFLCDHKSEFSKYSAEERKIESLTAAGLPEDYKFSDKLNSAIDRYNKLSNSRILRLLTSANHAVDQLTEYFKSVDYKQTDAEGKFLYDPKDVISNVSKLGTVIEGISKLEEAVRKEEGEESSTRGSAEKGRLS